MTPDEILNLTRDQKIRLACAMVLPISRDELSVEERMLRYYASNICPVEGHRRNPADQCVLCGSSES